MLCLSLSRLVFFVLLLLFIIATFCALLVYVRLCSVLWFFWLSVLAKWLSSNTPPRKPNCGEGIVSTKPGPKIVYDFLGSVYCLIVLWCVCVVPRPYVIMWYISYSYDTSPFALKVPLKTSQLTNSQCSLFNRIAYIYSRSVVTLTLVKRHYNQ